MGTDVSEAVETLPSPFFKVHHGMCTELMKFVERTTKIFPEIEAAQPRCTSGVQALCLLNNAIEKAKSLLQYCSESSKLYLAITGDVIALRCKRSRNLLEQSLSQIQNMVPVMLAVKISQIVDDLKDANFILDPSEQEAGKVVRELLQQSASATDSLECSEIKALQLAASRLCITSPKAILIEKRSIKKLLDKVGESDLSRKKILEYLLYLLKRHGNSIMREQKDDAHVQDEGSFTVCSQPSEVESHIEYRKYEVETNILSRVATPALFKCPLSLRLMHDPVIIESGQTFEKMWIQKWFDEGNDTCPKTKMKLVHQSLTPNMVLKDLISKWCRKYGITIPDPSMQTEAYQSWDTSSTSISSFASSMNDLHLPVDVSNISLGSLDSIYSSDTSSNKIAVGLILMSKQTNDDFRKCQSFTNINEIDLSRLAELNWECQCKVVEDTESCLKQYNQACHSLSTINFVEPLIRFLKDARDSHDIRAQRSGSQLLLVFVSKKRKEMLYLQEDVFCLLASFLDSEVIEEALAILEVLSSYKYCRAEIVACGALASISKILSSQNKKFREHAIKILQNFSSDNEIRPFISAAECIPELVPMLKDTIHAGDCLGILKNMCDTEDARICVAETTGCLPSVAQLLEIGSLEDQEHAAAILLSLCSQRVQYCHLVMNEGVIPSLVNISINGNDKGKVFALELLRLLRDIHYSDEQECFGSQMDTSRDASNHPKEKKSSSKTSGIFGRKFPMFSKSQFSRSRKEEMKLGY